MAIRHIYKWPQYVRTYFACVLQVTNMKVLKVPWDCSLLPQNMDLMIEYESSCCSAFQDHYRSVHEIFMAGLRRCFFSLEGLSRESYRRYRGRRR